MTRFVVDLGTAHISEQKKNTIAAAIQSAVLQHLADQEPPLERQLCLVPLTWLGLIYRPEIGEIERADQAISAFANASPKRETAGRAP
jgi:hypothetical protein